MAPKAPKDPEKNRPYFYIMRDKEVFGAKQPNGRGVTFIYEDNGRMLNSAKIVGNITDDEILKLMTTTEGFAKLVHSIGVSVEMDDPNLDMDFVFQMYGEKDTYGGGSNFRATLKGNGAETRLYVSEHEWTGDDCKPGQIRFECEKPEQTARVSVRFFLNDGFTAPEVIDEKPVDFTSDAYREMISHSLLNLGSSARLYKAIRKAKEGKDVTFAFIGGSITQGAGATPINTGCYAYKAYRTFADKYGNGDNVGYIKAGVGGTPSELGMLRFDRDVLRKGNGLSTMKEHGICTVEALPDIVVVEFAVNDEGDETKGECYESLVKRILNLPNQPAVILLFSVFADDYNLQERLSPVGFHYDLPMASVKDAVTPQFSLRDARVIAKSQYFYDVFHPTNAGHTIMADCISYLIDKTAEKMESGDGTEVDMTDTLLMQQPVIGADFENVRLMDRADSYAEAEIRCGGFTATDKELQGVEMDMALAPTPQFPYNWMYDGTAEQPGEPFFELDIRCRSLLIITKDSGAVDSGKADVYVEGKKVLSIDPRQVGWTHCNPQIVCRSDESRTYHVRVQIAEDSIDKKFTILGWGYVE